MFFVSCSLCFSLRSACFPATLRPNEKQNGARNPAKQRLGRALQDCGAGGAARAGAGAVHERGPEGDGASPEVLAAVAGDVEAEQPTWAAKTIEHYMLWKKEGIKKKACTNLAQPLAQPRTTPCTTPLAQPVQAFFVHNI